MRLYGFVCLFGLVACQGAPSVQPVNHLPKPDPVPAKSSVVDVRDATMPDLGYDKPPKGKPNVVVIMLDDLGFGATSTFGGPIETPTLDALADEGVRYTNFHTTSLCSPTRAALKTGRNHNRVNMGTIIEATTGFPGYTGRLPNEAASLAQILQASGYKTAAFGKWHNTAAWETTPAGPYDRWPTGRGFSHFYGFVAGETNQWTPSLYENTTPIEPPDRPGYHLSEDLADQAIKWASEQKTFAPDSPFFIYFAPGAVHAPHHVPQEWADRYDGAFDDGWMAMRDGTLERQKAAGLVPSDTVLPPMPEGLPEWDKLGDLEKSVYTRQMEVFAGFTSHVDHHIGRMLKSLKDNGQLENTIVLYLAGDNGTSGEGGLHGLSNESDYFNYVEDTVEHMATLLPEWGGPETYPHMTAAWASALDTPGVWMKQIAGDPGGTRVGMVASWPGQVPEDGSIRDQFTHVVDVAPTILDLVEVEAPKLFNGIPQWPLDGASFAGTLIDAKAPAARNTQYFLLYGSRAIYHDGWWARARHIVPWDVVHVPKLSEDKWELFHYDTDRSLAHDLAAEKPDLLAKLQEMFLREAKANYGLPIDDRRTGIFDAAKTGRPSLVEGRTEMIFEGETINITESNILNVKNKSWSIDIDLTMLADGDSGTLVAQGGRFGGWTVFMEDGKPGVAYNFLGRTVTQVTSETALDAGDHRVTVTFDYDGGGMGKGGTFKVMEGSDQLAEVRVPVTQPSIFSGDETFDIGVDRHTGVVPTRHGAGSEFAGEVKRVALKIDR